MVLTSMSGTAQILKDGCIRESATLRLWNRMVDIIWVNESSYPQLIIKMNRRKTETFFVIMATPTMSEITIFFYDLLLFNDGLQKRMLTVSQNYRTGTLIALHVQALVNPQKPSLNRSSFTDYSNATAPYMFFDNEICLF